MTKSKRLSACCSRLLTEEYASEKVIPQIQKNHLLIMNYYSVTESSFIIALPFHTASCQAFYKELLAADEYDQNRDQT